MSSSNPDVTGPRLVIWTNAAGGTVCGKNGWTALVTRVQDKWVVIDENRDGGWLEHHLTQSEWRRVQAHRRIVRSMRSRRKVA
jgi:hypothetical protein